MRNPAMSVKGKDPGKLIADMQRLAGRQVLVGFPEGDSRPDGMTNAALAYIHDNGAPDQNIPARPFMMPAMDECRDDLAKKATQVIRAVSRGEDVIDQGMHQMGLIASTAIKDAINSNTPPPLAESTIVARQARGLTRTNTLIDTGAMRNAVTYVIKDSE